MKEIGIKLALDGAAKVQSELKGVEAGLGRLGSSMKTVAANAGSFAASLGLGISVGKLVQVQREFDVLNASLKTVTGSSAAAAKEMEWLKAFAKETPFGLDQATQGFVKMKALGLDPTRSALTSFGNTASAMGKDLNQMIEAVADASTGEFERLKEFGIKAKKEGDNVSLTFQGVTTTIKNSAEEITKYLEDIGNNQFGGAMEERAKTLDGAIAGLGDTWDELFRTVNERNAGTLIHDSVKLATGAIEDATTILRAMTGAANDNAAATGAMSTIQNGIATVFETVAVLGANLKYVLVQIGTEIYGLAKQVAQAAQFNFSGVAAIREQMVADAEEARRQIDATTARILGARKAQEEYARYATRNASAATDPRRIDLGKPTASGKPTGRTDTSINAANKALQDQAKLLAELSGLSGSFSADWAQLNAAYASGKLTLDGLTAAQAALLEKQPAMKAAADEEKKAQEVLTRAYQEAAAERIKIAQSMEQSAVSAAEQNQSLREEIELIGLTEEQQTRVLQQRNEAIILTKEATLAELERQSAITGTMTREQIALAAEIEALKERNELLGAKSVKNTAAEAAKKAEDEWKKTTDQINESLTDALMRGFESGKDFAKNMRDTVVNMFKTMVLRPVISVVLSPVSGAINGAVGSAVGSVGSSMLTSMGGSVIGNTVMGGLGSIGGVVGTAYNTALGTSLGLGSSSAAAAAQAASMAGGTGAASASLGSMLGAAMPWIAGAGAIYSIAKSFDNSGTPHMGAGAIYKDGRLREGKDLYGSGAFNMGHRDEYNANSQANVSGIASVVGGALDSVAVAFGKKAGYEIATAFADDSSSDGAWGSLRISMDGQDVLNWRNTQTSRWAPKEFGNGEGGYKEYLAAVAKDTRQVLLDMDLPGWADTVLNAIGESPSIESLSAALTQIGEIQTVFVALGKSLNGFTNLTDKAKETLLGASGGAQALAQNATAFYQGYYSERERISRDTAELTESFKTLGFTLPRSTEELRALIEAQIAVGDAGVETAGKLLALSGSFANVSSATEAAQRAFTENLINLESRFKDGGLSRRRQVESLVPQLSALLSGTSLQESDRALASRMLTSTSDDIEAYFRKVWEVLPNDDARAKLVDVTDAMLSLSEASEEAAKNLADAAIEFAQATARTTEEARYITALGAVGNRSALQELGMPGVGQTTAMRDDQSTLQSLSNVIVVPAVQAPVIDVVKQAQAAATEQYNTLAKQIANTPGLESALQIGGWLPQWRGVITHPNRETYGIPAFADGGYHFGGARLVGERGREIEVTGPSMILSNPITEAILGRSDNDGAVSAAVVAELRNLRAEVANLRAETRAVVTHTATTARIIKRVTPDGDALQTREVAAV